MLVLTSESNLRCGQVPNKDALKLTEALMADPKNRLCGLGPRDSLRLEAGLCLYGNDLEQHLTPVEAGLTWTIGKKRREDWSMLGGSVLKQQVADGVTHRRVGFVTTGAPSRQGCEITDLDGNRVSFLPPCARMRSHVPSLHRCAASCSTRCSVARTTARWQAPTELRARDAVRHQ